MKTMNSKIIYLAIFVSFFFISCASTDKGAENIPNFTYGENSSGSRIDLKFEKGKTHNHPLFAIWLADENGKFIQTLYVSESIGKGVFKHSNRESGKWLAGEIQRPAALPFWAHERNIINEMGTFLPTPENPEIDAHTGATPLASFDMTLFTNEKLNGKYRLYLELNQSWDWNEFWTNNKYPENQEYKTSSQPALIYLAEFDTKESKTIELKAIGHSHYAGENGELNTDLSTLTTAMNIAKKITIRVS